MYRKHILIAILVLALVSMACGVNIEIPVRQVKTGPTETTEINVPPLPVSGEVAKVTLGFGAGELNIEPGSGASLVAGTARYNVSDFKPEITVEADEIGIEQGDLNLKGFPDFNGKLINEWDLTLGSYPMELTIIAGAYKGKIELGGVPLHALAIKDGASSVSVEFSQPNPVEMSTLRYETGASDVELSGLANANFEEMFFTSGAGSYRLDFSGGLRRDASVEIESGVSSVTVIVPEGTPAELRFEGGLTNISLRGAWQGSGDVYTLSGSGPKLTIYVKMGAGSLELRSK